MKTPSVDPAGQIAGCGQISTFQIPCADGHDVVYGLAAGRGNEIYLAASNEFCPGLCAVVFAFDVVTEKFRQVIDVQEATGFEPSSGLMPHCKIHLCLNSTPDGRLFTATHFTAPGVGQKDFDAIAAYRGKYAGCFFLEYDSRADRVINHGLLLKGEGARISCLDEKNHRYYFISYPRSHLYRYDYDERALHDLGRIGQENAFGLEVDDEGDVITSDDLGRFIRYSLKKDRLEELNVFVPQTPGRRSGGNYIRRMTKGLDGCLYGFGNKGMRFFQLDPKRKKVTDFGVIFGAEGDRVGAYPSLPPAKAIVQTDPRTLLIAFGGDGIYADRHPIPNLVRFDLLERQTTDLGKFVCPEDGLPAWIPQCALSVPRANAVFFGLQQTVGELRLWKADLSQQDELQLRAPGELYQKHLTVIQNKPFGASVEGAASLPFVRSGQVQMQELGWSGEDRVIPAGETAIAALCFVGWDTLYGLTTGRCGHLFSFRPYQQNRFTENYEVHPWDLGAVVAEPTLQARLFHDPQRQRLLIAVQTSVRTEIRAFSVGAELKRYRGAYHSVPHWPPVQWEGSPFSLLAQVEHSSAEFENLSYLARPDAFFSTTASGQLLRLSCGGPHRVLEFDAVLSRPGLVAIGEDRLLGLARTGEGLLLRLDAQEALTVEAKFSPGGGAASCFAVDDAQVRVAIGRIEGGLDILDLRRPSDRVSLRLPCRWKVRALAWHPNGRLYGFYGGDDQIGEAFSVDPSTGMIQEIGILQVSSQPRYWMCHRCDALAVGARGEIYYGESDRIAHLFSFVDPSGPNC